MKHRHFSQWRDARRLRARAEKEREKGTQTDFQDQEAAEDHGALEDQQAGLEEDQEEQRQEEVEAQAGKDAGASKKGNSEGDGGKGGKKVLRSGKQVGDSSSEE